VTLPAGEFVTYLFPVKANYSFTPRASLSALGNTDQGLALLTVE
jgi:hypothetical protein